jgi:hypothetical protein
MASRRGVIAALVTTWLPNLFSQTVQTPKGPETKPVTDFVVNLIDALKYTAPDRIVGIDATVRTTATERIGVRLTFKGPSDSYMIVVNADGREIKLTAKEVMDSLEAK